MGLVPDRETDAMNLQGVARAGVLGSATLAGMVRRRTYRGGAVGGRRAAGSVVRMRQPHAEGRRENDGEQECEQGTQGGEH